MTPPSQWRIPRPVWMVLASWGLAVLMVAGLLSYWIWHNEQEQEKDEAALQLQQDRAVCGIIRAITDGPEPVPGPEGDRGRSILKALQDWSAALHCDELTSANPGPARERDHK
jgi:hypothetical protein